VAPEAENSATGRGVMIIVREALAERGKSLVGMRVVIQGFGNVGSAVVYYCTRLEPKFWLSTGSGGIFAEAGLDIPAPEGLRCCKPQAIAGFPGAVPHYEYPTADPACDVLIPAALENQITEENVNQTKRPLWQRLLMDRSA